MDIDQIILEKQRRQCWIDAWCAVASAINCSKTESATAWADTALEEFDKRFKIDSISH